VAITVFLIATATLVGAGVALRRMLAASGLALHAEPGRAHRPGAPSPVPSRALSLA
jgi:hypothetical protein